MHLNIFIIFRYIKSPELLHKLIDLGLTFKLLPLLSKSNLKVVDIAFSIMGNIMLEDLPKKQVKERGSGGKNTNTLRGQLLHPDSRPGARRDPADRLPLREAHVVGGVSLVQGRYSTLL